MSDGPGGAVRWRSRLLSSEGMVWMQAALPSALLADMSEQQQMDLALELSIYDGGRALDQSGVDVGGGASGE